ncbi:MAG: hypothetical protein M3Z13_03745, partial [Candidatus Dormibacteraeota bacterium]|nr:hypothetical protein [Candidatus Dormibacteraeota bacterium]
MARAIWTGTISFGLVNIGVRLVPATRRKDLRFHEIDRRTGQRVQHQRVRMPMTDLQYDTALDAKEPESLPVSDERLAPLGDRRPAAPFISEGAAERVALNEIIKGFEVAPDQYITVSREEIEELQPERTKRIDIEQFVPWDQVDPVYLDTSYHVAPQRQYERPFALLVEALASDRKVAVSWLVLRQKRHLAVLRPAAGLLMLSTMFHADEVLPGSEVSLPISVTPSEKELKMAGLLIGSMSGDFEPARYDDEYRRRLTELIESRAGEGRV